MLTDHTLQIKIETLRLRLQSAYRLLNPCNVCPRACGVNRLKNEKGFCGESFLPRIASANLHNGEEPPISGQHGSGTIFFTGCTLKCDFCQNYPISQLGNGHSVTLSGLADLMLDLQRKNAHNINLVTPTHFTPQIMAALFIAYKNGLKLPIVYNCSGYESIEILKLLDGIVDIYLPDMKYNEPVYAGQYSHAKDYPEINRRAILEMQRQVGVLRMDKNEIAVSGLIIRHLVLPENISGTEKVLRFIAESISADTHISLMSQYFPVHKSLSAGPMNRRISSDEYQKAVDYLDELRLTNGWVQHI